MRKLLTRWLHTAILIGFSATAAAPGDRLADIRSRGTLNCGIWPYVPGFAVRHGDTYVGFDIDTCRAIAAAILGDASKVRFVELAHVEQFLQRVDIDLVVRRLTSSPAREAATGTMFGPVTFHDGQGFLVPRRNGIKNIAQLRTHPICVIDVERHPQILYRFLREAGAKAAIMLVEDDRRAEEALRQGRCAAYSADISWLAAARAGFADGPELYEILPERISTEPLAPLMRAEDGGLVQIVRRTVSAMLEAEALGITSSSVAPGMTPEPRMGNRPVTPAATGSAEQDALMRAVILGVGNYAEMYERNLGAGSDLNLERGRNRLRNHGGLLLADGLDDGSAATPKP